MQKDIQEIKEDIADIKLDLRYHIKRTNELEKMVLPLYKFRVWAQYTLIIITAYITIRSLL